MVQAARKRGYELDLVAVNHWPVAVRTHTANHPWARHVCADLASVEADPNRLVPGGTLDLLVASPECTHHSVARGGKPCSDQSRASAWHVLHWVERLNVTEGLVENVREFKEWGPLNDEGRPDKALKGATFNAWVSALKSMGYTVDHRVINAADYGSATTRRRLFVRFSKRGPIVWPHESHAQVAADGRKRWKPARDVIDWGLKGESIFNRRRPLKPKTLARIEAGLRKFGGEAFIAVLRGTNQAQEGSWSGSLDDPLKTISAGGIHAALCQPFLVEYHGEKSENTQRRVKSVDEPLPVQTTENRFGLCQPFVFNVAHAGGERVSSCDEPLGTFPAGHRGELALCEPFLTKYYGCGDGARPVTEPLDTVTTKDRFALVQPKGIDILFRMLQPHELAAAMGFEGYEFTGTKTDQVRQIGNAVAVEPAEALCGSVMDELTKGRVA